MTVTIEDQTKVIKKLHKSLKIPKHYAFNFVYKPGKPAVSRRDPPPPPITISARQKALYELREAGIVEDLSPAALLDRITRRLNQAFVESDRRTPVGRKPGK